jgi:hypothetical protein
VLGDSRSEEALAEDVKVGGVFCDPGEVPDQVVVLRGGEEFLDDATASGIHAERHLVADRLLERVARQDGALLDLLRGLRVRLEQRLDLVEVRRGALVDGVAPAVDAQYADAAAVVPVELVSLGRVGHGAVGWRWWCAVFSLEIDHSCARSSPESPIRSSSAERSARQVVMTMAIGASAHRRLFAGRLRFSFMPRKYIHDMGKQ